MRYASMKRTFYLPFILGILFLSLFSPVSFSKILEKIVMRINDDVITQHDLEIQENIIMQEVYRKYKGKDLDKAVRETKDKILENLIDETLLLQKAKELGYDAPDDRVREVIDAIKKSNGLETDRQLEQALAEEGMTLDLLRESARRRILLDAVKRSEIGARIVLSDKEVEEYYENHKEEYVEEEQIRLQEIVLTGEGRESGEVEKEANQLYQLILKGSKFPELAIFFSQAPTAEHGGDMGYLKLGDLSTEVRQVVASLKPGEVSKPIKMDYGYHILMLVDRKPKTYKPLDKVRDEITLTSKGDKFNDAYAKYIKELRANAFIEYMDK
jgi:parvulin-like peptidyl-prolyl isomerase